ncbi:MAG TPA: site-2 protease family protein [Ktedonobacteraceae bacterium]|nr:site-2 protease family protein [Ktedonobacteraceae bacterium]
MRWNPNDYAKYGTSPGKEDYSDPAYYKQATRLTPQAPRADQPVQSLESPPATESYADYANGPTLVNAQGPTMMREYRGPTGMEGYTADAGAEQREAAAHGKVEAGKKRKGLAGLGGIGATIGALLLKFKAVLLLLLNLKWVVFLAKFGWVGFSALLSIAIYSLIFGWQFAIGLVVLLFIHEMGHALVMKLKGIPVGGLIFIPMLGAAVLMRQMPKNAQDEAEVGIAGPIAGAIASGACLALAELTPHTTTIWAALAYFGFFMNLFNLVPVLPFDGGRVLGAIDRRIWIVGFLALLGFQIWQWINGISNIFLLFFIIIAATQLWSRRGLRTSAAAQEYYNVPIATRIALSVLYFGLAAALILGMSIAHGLILPVG